VILQSASEWQCDKGDWSAKIPIFRFNWLLWQRPLTDHKVLYQVNKPFHPSTNSKIWVKFGPISSEKQVLKSQPLKKYLKIKKNIGKIYSPSGNFTEWAK